MASRVLNPRVINPTRTVPRRLNSYTRIYTSSLAADIWTTSPVALNRLSSSLTISPLNSSRPKLPNTSKTLTTFTSRNMATAAPSSLPDTMSTVQIPRNGGPEVLTHSTTAPLPALKQGHVLVRNTHAGVNFIDTYFRTGLYPTPAESFPLTLGREAAGTIAAVDPSVPASANFSPGDPVVYMSAAGSYATYSSVPAAHVLRLPPNLGPAAAAASLLQGLTAWTFVREAAEVRPGETVLVHAAAGGVGGLLVQMLKAVGANTIAVARGAHKCELAAQKGATHVVDTGIEGVDLVAEIQKITGGKGADVIFDGVGKATFEADLAMAARKGRIISFGNASGAVPPVDILRLGAKNIKLMRPVVNNYVTERDELEQYADELFDLITSGKVEVPVWKTYALADAAQAHIDLESRKTTGKLLLKID